MNVARYLITLTLMAMVATMAPTLDASVQAEPAMDPTITGSIAASVSCSFNGPRRRGFCSANPRGTGFTYTFYTSGPVSVATGPAHSPDRSATCSGPGSVTVVVTDGAGNSGTASTSTSCP